MCQIVLSSENANFQHADFRESERARKPRSTVANCRSTAFFSEIQSSFCGSGERFVSLLVPGQSESYLR
jgi:hypothetical protein